MSKNITNSDRLDKNKRIAEAKRNTSLRHSSMLCKTYLVKIDWSKCSNIQKEALEMKFVEGKWFKNYILDWSKEEGNDISKFDTSINTITHKDKDMNDVKVTLKYFMSSEKQGLWQNMLSNIKTLSTLKKKGYQEPGELKFIKELKAYELKQYGVTHKIVSKNRIKLQGVKRPYYATGMEQFINIPGIEYTNARLINRPDGYFIALTCFIPKDSFKKKNNNSSKKELGAADLGCKNNITTSDGDVYNVSVQESDRLKRLQRKEARQKKGSKNRYKTRQLINKEYQKLKNKKENLSNQIVSNLYSKYEKVIIQDEQIAEWKKNSINSKVIHHSVLGRIKTKLINNPSTVVLNKYLPTTKLCTNCGKIHDEMTLKDRTFNCECGIIEDRDIHAAKNMIWLYEHKIGMERTELTRVEMQERIQEEIQKSSLSKKHEAVESLAQR